MKDRSSSDLQRLRENAIEACRQIDLADRRIRSFFLSMKNAEYKKFGEALNAALNCLDRAQTLLPKPTEVGMSMAWTTTPPTEPGYYWVSWKPDWCFTDEIVRVRFKRNRGQDTNELVVCPTGTEARYSLDIAQRWAGPIPEAEETT